MTLNTTPIKTTGQLIARLQGTNLDILGFLVWWNIREITITRDEFIVALKTAGIDDRYAREHNYRSALIRALRSLEEERLIRSVHEDRVNIVFQFTAEVKVEDQNNPSLQYKPEVTITVDKEAYGMFQDFAQAITKVTDLKTNEESIKSAEIKAQIAAAFELQKNSYKSSDITRYIRRILEDNADFISLRQQGSVYFVPAKYQETISKVTTLVNQLGGPCVFQAVPIPDVAGARKMVGDSFAEEVATTIAGMDKEVQEVQSADKKVSQKWIEHRMSQIQKIKNRIDMYFEVLGGKAAELNGQFDKLSEIIQKTRVLEI